MRYSQVVIALLISYFIFAILLNSVGAVILQSIHSFGISKSDASILEAFKDLPIAIVSFIVASSLPRFGYKNSLITAFVIVGAACLIMPLVPDFLTAKLLFMSVGAAFALTKISVYSTIGLLTETPDEHVSLMNMIEGGFMLGVLFGYWLFSVFVDTYSASSLSWLNVYWLLSVACFVNALFLLTTKFPPMDKTHRQAYSTYTQSFKDMMTLAWKPAVLVFVSAAFLYVLIEQGLGTWMPTFNNEVLLIPAAMSIQLTGIYAGAFAIGRFSAGLITRKISWYALLIICIIATAVLILIAMPLAQNVQIAEDVNWLNAPLAAYIFPLTGLFLAPIYPAISSVILTALPRTQHASMSGLIVVFSALGGTAGSFLTGQMFEHAGGRAAFYLMVLPLIGLLIFISLLRRLTKPAKAQV